MTSDAAFFRIRSKGHQRPSNEVTERRWNLVCMLGHIILFYLAPILCQTTGSPLQGLPFSRRVSIYLLILKEIFTSSEILLNKLSQKNKNTRVPKMIFRLLRKYQSVVVPCFKRLCENCVKIKINFNFYFHTSLSYTKRFYEGL